MCIRFERIARYGDTALRSSALRSLSCIRSVFRRERAGPGGLARESTRLAAFIVNGTNALSEGGGFTLATIVLRVEQDVVSLCRRARLSAEEFGLDSRDVRRLSAALFEVGCQLTLAAPETRAELMISDGPSLEAQFHVAGVERVGGPVTLERSLTPLRSLVHRLVVVPSSFGAVVSLRTLFRTADSNNLSTTEDSHLIDRPRDGPPGGTLDEDEASALQRVYGELHETNRGVVALYAELEENGERLRLAEDKLRLLLDSVQDYAICMLSPHGVVTTWNAGGERLFGYPADEIIGRSFATFFSVPDREEGAPAAQLLAAEADGRMESEGLRLRRGGAAFDAHVVLTPVRDAARQLRGFSLVVRDITERKRLEDDLRRRAEDLAIANRAKEDFLATLSHELRTPLNAMLGWTRLLRMGKLDAAGVARALETIERNAHLQEQLISDILDVSRIVTGKLRLELRPTDLAPLVDATLDTLRPAADAKGVALRARLQCAGAVLGDPDRLQQVIWNLIVNAVKFTPTGGSVVVSLDRQGTNAVVTVTDTGEGIASDLLPYIFDRFRQGDASVTRPHGGLGLGLSIVRHIVELHGGRVNVHSAGPGQGATFSVMFPIRAIRRVQESQSPDAHLLSGLRVLVVDDESDAREVVSRALTECGARTAAVGSAREALEVLPDFKPDVLVSDIRMPGEDGYTLIRRIRALDSNAGGLPAIALTALAHPEDRRRALTAGYQSFVPKPVEVDELAAVIRRVSGKD
jgi:PAS domain S-box-containing protein